MLILIHVFPGFTEMICSLTPGDIGHQVANTHTIFAILAVILEFPFANAIVALSQKVIPVLPEENRAVEDRKLRYLVQTGDLPSSVAIQQAKLELIFERFYRVDKSRSRETGGTGLGLAIVKHIAEIHDAEISVDSEPGKGTLITVQF